MAILEDLVITLAEGAASMYLELISVDSRVSNEMNSLGLSLCTLSTRELQKLRNEVNFSLKTSLRSIDIFISGARESLHSSPLTTFPYFWFIWNFISEHQNNLAWVIPHTSLDTITIPHFLTICLVKRQRLLYETEKTFCL